MGGDRGAAACHRTVRHRNQAASAQSVRDHGGTADGAGRRLSAGRLDRRLVARRLDRPHRPARVGSERESSHAFGLLSVGRRDAAGGACRRRECRTSRHRHDRAAVAAPVAGTAWDHRHRRPDIVSATYRTSRPGNAFVRRGRLPGGWR